MEEGAHKGQKTTCVKHGRKEIMGMFLEPLKLSSKLELS